jgi:hypothetical protein
MEVTQQEKHEEKARGSFQDNNQKVESPAGGKISDTTIEDSDMNGVTTAKQITEIEGAKNYQNTSTKSSEVNSEHAINMN